MADKTALKIHTKEIMTSTVLIKNGEYRNIAITNEVFPLVKPYQLGAKGGFITVDATVKFGELKHIRVKVDGPAEFEVTHGTGYSAPTYNAQNEYVAPVEVIAETDEEIMARIKERFDILDDMTKAAISGDIRALIVSGPPGVGKSYGVEQEIEKATLFDKLAGTPLKAEVVKGSATPIGLYQALYRYSRENCVIVFDDCDSILLDDVSLNLLKGALDSGKKRKISWLSESRVLKDEGIPNSFDFNGSVIFLTNLKFDKMKSPKLREHLDALQSRCHYLDLTLNTMRDKILRIRQIARDGGLFAEYGFAKETEDELIAFLEDSQDKLREVSLRMAIKIADLRKSFPDRWKAMAEMTCMY